MKKRHLRALSVLTTLTLTLQSPAFTNIAYAGNEENTGAATEAVSEDEVYRDGMVTGGYIEMPWDNDTPVVSDELDYYDALDGMVDKQADTGRKQMQVPNAYTYVSDPGTMDAKYPAGTETEILNYFKNTFPATRAQSPYGSCWAHSAISLAEFYLIKHGLKDTDGTVDKDVDYSELQLAYFCYHQAPDNVQTGNEDTVTYYPNAGKKKSFLDFGGNLDFASQSLMRYNGVIKDEDDAAYSNAENVLNDGLAEEYASSRDVAHLKNAYYLNIHENARLVKQAIKENGIVGVSIYADDKYINEATSAYYNDTEPGTNHAVAIVGWDDDYAASNFKTTPGGNGAWLVRNSWTTYTEYSYYSYFWLSYYDVGLEDTAYVYEMADIDNGEYYDNNYYYDSQTHGSVPADSKKVANIFTAVKNSETLKAVQIEATVDIPGDYTVEIYKNLADSSDPESGTKVTAAKTTGNLPFTGKYTIPLNADVELSEGETFAIVVTTQNEINQECDYIWSEQIAMDTAVGAGESFFYSEDEWKDVAQNSDNGRYGNIVIRALTNTNGGASLPDKISSLTVKNTSDQSVSLAWSAADAEGYEIWYSDAEDGAYTKAGDTIASEKKYRHTGLSAGTTYYYKVYPIKGRERYEAGVSPTVSATTVSATPEVKVVNVGRYIATARWKALDNCDGYELQFGLKSGAYYYPEPTTKTEVVLSGLDPGTWHFVKVRSYKTLGDGTKSYSPYCYEEFETLSGDPVPVTNLVVEPYSSTMLKASWDDDPEHSSYWVECSTNGVDYFNPTPYAITGQEPDNLWYPGDLTPNTKYYVRVRTKYYRFGNNMDQVVTDPVIVYTMFTQPNMKLVTVDENGLKLKWDAVAGAAYYSVYRKESSASEYVPLVVVPAAETNEYIDNTVVPGKTYYYRVCACRTNTLTDTEGEASWEYGNTFPLAEITDLTISNIGSRKATLSWSPISGAKGYKIKLYDYDNYRYEVYDSVDSESTSYVITGLTPQEYYTVMVCPFTESYEGWGNYESFWTTEPEPLPSAEKGFFSFSNTSAVYDGSSHPVTVNCTVDEISDEGIEIYYGSSLPAFTGWSKTAPKDAGTYYVGVKTKDTAFYAATELYDETWKLTISPKSITPTVTLAQDSYGYNGAERRPAVTVKDADTVLSAETDYTVSYSNNIYAGTASVTVKAKTGSNYSFTDKETTFTINKSTTTVTINGGDRTTVYGNAPFTLTALSGLDGRNPGWIWASSDTDVAEVNASGVVTVKKTGTAEISAAYSSDDTDGNGSILLTVNKAPLNVKANDNSITYGDVPAAAGVTFSGFVNGDDTGALTGSVTYSFDYEQYDDAGNAYKITPAGLTAENYEITFVPGTLKAEPREVGLIWSGTSLSYNGLSQKPEAEATGLIHGDSCEVSISGGGINAGTYTATASALSNKNYKLPAENTHAFTINKAVHEDMSAEGNVAYGCKATIDLSAVTESGGVLNITAVSDENGILDGEPVIKGTGLAVAAVDDKAKTGSSATLTVTVSAADNYFDYKVRVTVNVIECKHEHTEIRDKKTATCTEEGYTGDTYCSDCGRLLGRGEATPTDPDNHLYDDGVITREADMFREGIRTFTCVRCHKTYTESIPKLEGGDQYEELMEDTMQEDGTPDIRVKKEPKEDGSTETVITVGDDEVSRVLRDSDDNVISSETKIWIGGLHESYTYTGTAIKPEIHVYDGAERLEEGKDYSLKYADNKNAKSTATISVVFKGSYKSTAVQKLSFRIDPADLSKDVEAGETAVAVSGKELKPVPEMIMKATGKKIGNQGFTFTYRDAEGKTVGGINEAGIYSMDIKAADDSFTGSLSVRIVATDDPGILLSGAKVSMNPKKYVYTGEPVIPAGGSELRLNGTVLSEGSDYVISEVAGNVEPGTATVIFTAVSGNKAGYVGSRSATFKIVKGRVLQNGDAVTEESVPYVKGGAKPAVRVKIGNNLLKEGRDYTLKYSGNTAVTSGKTAVVTVKGKGKYKGSIRLNYAVTKQDIKSLSANMIVGDKVESAKGYRDPVLNIYDTDGKKLKKNKDYVIAEDYSGPDAEGNITVSVKGTGNYDGEVKITYRYISVSAQIGKCKAFKVRDMEYTGSAVLLKAEDLTQIIYAGSKASPVYLVPGKDFVIAGYNNNVKTGTAKVTVRGIGQYGGIKTLSFKIVARKGKYKGALVDGKWK